MKSNLVPIPTEADLSPTESIIKKIGRRLYEVCSKIIGVSDKVDFADLLKERTITIIDVGARFGFHSRWEQLGKNLRIILFEPNSDGYKELVAQYKNDPRVKIYNTALSENDTDITINIAAFPYASSIFKHNENFFSKLNFRDLCKDIDKVEMPSKALRNVISGEFDFIKLDVEGYELAILKGSGQLLDTCIGIEAEVSYNSWADGLPLFGDIDSFCKSKGFILSRLSPISYYHYILPDKRLEAQGVAFSGDALYFRTPYSIVELVKSKRWSDEKVVTSLAVYLCYGNYEFAYILIQEAIKENMLKQNDEIVRQALQLISKRSGWKKRINISTLRIIQKFFRVYSPKGLDI